METINRDIDPRAKLIIVICISSLAVWIQDIQYLFVILLVSIMIGKLVNSQMFSVLRKLRKMMGIFIAIMIIQSLFSKMGSPVVSFGGVTLLTDLGIKQGVGFILRMMIILVSATILTTSTSREIVQGLVQWKIPYEIAFMVSIAIRFLPMLMEEIQDTFIAIQLRGITLEALSFKEKIKIYAYIFTPIVVGTIIKSQKLSIAMETRGFRAYTKRTSYMKLCMETKDYCIIVFTVMAFLFTAYHYLYI
ncbi:energy-coupling factor transporter transmembrane component T [Clostridiaceae bacterium 35-E11]